jgi:hypothetical protein
MAYSPCGLAKACNRKSNETMKQRFAPITRFVQRSGKRRIAWIRASGGHSILLKGNTLRPISRWVIWPRRFAFRRRDFITCSSAKLASRPLYTCVRRESEPPSTFCKGPSCPSKRSASPSECLDRAAFTGPTKDSEARLPPKKGFSWTR